VAAEYRTLVSPHAGTHENHNGIYIASQALGNDTMVARSVDDTTMVAHSSDVLQFINKFRPGSFRYVQVKKVSGRFDITHWL
jgi:hypothetical protein